MIEILVVNDILERYFDTIDTSLDAYIELLVEITETPAPPFKESRRAELIGNKFSQLGYLTKIDSIGNVLAYHPENRFDETVIFAAHLDTVFGEDVEIEVKTDGNRLSAPGIADDSAGLVNLIYLAKFTLGFDIKRNIIFVANVGEEGRGDLRGTKYLFTAEEHQTIKPIVTFITIDGVGLERNINQSIGSIRYNVIYKADGGHSYGAFGQVNPGFALASFLNEMAEIKVPTSPKTTYSVGVIRGGTSVNSIPHTTSAEIDMRSSSVEELSKLHNKVVDIAEKAVQTEKERRNGEIKLVMEKIGDRPVGETSSDDPLIKIMEKTNLFFGLETNFIASSTDANIPHSMGIPALSIAGINTAGRAHSLDEWLIADDTALLTLKRNLLLLYLLTAD